LHLVGILFPHMFLLLLSRVPHKRLNILRRSVSRLDLVQYGSVQTDREIPTYQRAGE